MEHMIIRVSGAIECGENWYDKICEEAHSQECVALGAKRALGLRIKAPNGI